LLKEHIMNFKLSLVAAAAMALGIFATPVVAQEDPHIRGKITAIDGAVYGIETADGQTVSMTLAAEHTVLLYTPLAFKDIKAKDYLAIPSVPTPEGGKKALAIIVFPEAMRGLNEGNANWDLVPGSKMTNATLAEVKASTGGAEQMLTVTHGSTSEDITVPNTAPVVTFAPAAGRALKVGEQAIFFTKAVDGGLTAGLVGVSADGSLPPL
jgi:hypothetical protein